MKTTDHLKGKEKTMNISIDKESSIPVYRQIEAAIKKRILSGEYPYGWRLPSERRLAAIVGVHRNTVIKAYKLLVDQELISSDFEGRKGYFVISGKAEDAGPAQRKTAPAVFSYHTNITACGKIFEDIFEASFNRENISFGGHIAPEEIINLEHIKDVMDKVISIYGKEAFYYCQAKGDIILRKQLALALQEEGINTRAGDVVIINETTHGLEYMANILASEKDYVVSESPIMPDNYSLFLDRGLQVILAPMEEDGVDMAQLENIFRKYHPRFFHTMPDYHGVTGARMSLEKRHALIDLADRYDVPIVEESWCNGIDFDEESLPTLYSLDKRHNVIYMDSALTKFYYGSKIAYILAPTETASIIGRQISGTQVHTQKLEQLMFAEYLKAGYHHDQRREMVAYYKEKCRKMETAMEPLRQRGLSWQSPKGGMGIWCKLPKGINDMKLYEALRRRKVLICPGKLFFPGGTEEGGFMRLSFSNISDANIEKGMSIIYDEIVSQDRK